MKKHLISFVLFSFLVSFSQAQDTVKIMPVGNSITAGEHYGYPVLEERIGYRKALYELLINSGYNVDFVGSQKHGIRSGVDPDWYDWNNEAYPGWKIPEITEKVNAALPVYKPDILLVHVGTNGTDWSSKPEQVMALLDTINRFSVEHDHSITVLLSLIINRYKGGDTATTQFNKELAKFAKERTGDEIRIIPVDMENGAGLDYTDDPANPDAKPPYEGGDMLGETYPGVTYDRYHPNDKGNTKMAIKFYKELLKVLPLSSRK